MELSSPSWRENTTSNFCSCRSKCPKPSLTSPFHLPTSNNGSIVYIQICTQAPISAARPPHARSARRAGKRRRRMLASPAAPPAAADAEQLPLPAHTGASLETKTQTHRKRCLHSRRSLSGGSSQTLPKTPPFIFPPPRAGRKLEEPGGVQLRSPGCWDV